VSRSTFQVPSAARQMDFFTLVEDGGETIQVKVYQDGVRGYCAMIADGWWRAYGSTREKAIRNVVAKYEMECSYAG